MVSTFKIIKKNTEAKEPIQIKEYKLDFSGPDFDKSDFINFSLLLNHLSKKEPDNSYLLRIYQDFIKNGSVNIDEHDLYMLQCLFIFISPNESRSANRIFENAQKFYKYIDKLMNQSTPRNRNLNFYLKVTLKMIKDIPKNIANKSWIS